MALEGWYYLHENGDLIYKGAAYTSLADFHDSDLVRAYWKVTPDDREQAWNTVVEALAAGANPERVRELADQWGCTDEDAQEYARRVNVTLSRDVDDASTWVAIGAGPAVGLGPTCLEAMADLAKVLGYRATKGRGPGFGQLASAAVPS